MTLTQWIIIITAGLYMFWREYNYWNTVGTVKWLNKNLADNLRKLQDKK